MKEIKRNAEVGEKIKVVVDHKAWKPVYKLGEICIVEKKMYTSSERKDDFSKGMVGCVGKSAYIFPASYVVLEED